MGRQAILRVSQFLPYTLASILLKIEYFAVSNIPSKFTFPVKMTDNANNTGPKQQKNFNKEYCFSERINKL